MTAPWLRETADGVELSILVQPRASRSRLVGEHDGRLKVAVAAPPVDGEANAALLEFLADLFSVGKRAVELIDGAQGRRKRVLVRGVRANTAEVVISDAT